MPPKGMLSQERVEDSSGEDSSTSEPTQTLKERLNSIKQSVPESSADGDSGSEEEGSGSDGGSSSGSPSTRSNSSSATKRKLAETQRPITETTSKKARTNYDQIKRVESTTYAPPQGYQAASEDISTADQTMFNNINDKQIWYITAPSTMPIEQIESLDVGTALREAPVLKHNGTTYTMTKAQTNGSTLLLPKDRHNVYTSTGQTVTQAFCIQESSRSAENAQHGRANDDDLDAERQSLSFFASKTGHRKLPRQQPRDLKARYVPYGVTLGTKITGGDGQNLKDTDVLMADAVSDHDAATLSLLQPTPGSSKKTKKKSSADDGIVTANSPLRTKTKAKESTPSQESTLPDSSQKKRKKKREREKGSED